MGQMLDQVVEVVGEMRELLSEARGLLKDLRYEIKEGKELKKELKTVIKDIINTNLVQEIDLAVKESADIFNKDIKDMHAQAEKDIIESFERLTNTLLYGNKSGKGANVLEDIMKSKGLIK
jgi:hypothetical protein